MLRQRVLANAGCSGRFSGHRHHGHVSAKAPDVVLDPLDGQQLVPESVISWQRLVSGAEKPQGSQSVLDHHHDHVLLRGQLPGVVLPAGTCVVRPSVDPDHHRSRFACLEGIVVVDTVKRLPGQSGVVVEDASHTFRGVHVQQQAVLRLFHDVRRLWTPRPESRCVEDGLEQGPWLRGFPALVLRWGESVRDSSEGEIRTTFWAGELLSFKSAYLCDSDRVCLQGCSSNETGIEK